MLGRLWLEVTGQLRFLWWTTAPVLSPFVSLYSRHYWMRNIFMTLKLSQVVFSFVSSYIFKILISSYQNADHNFLKKYSRLTLSYLIHLALQLDCERGTIASHSTMLLRSTVRPHRRAQYLWTISYQTMDSSGRQKTNITQCIQLFHSLT